jgi:ubiquinone/menaquinone biosynthesis C-methylase UbiE
LTASLPGVRRVYAASAERYDRRWRDYLRATIPPTVAALGSGLVSVLDVGCGTGVLLEEILAREPGIRAAGVDISPEMLNEARARLGGRAELVRSDAARLPFGDRSFSAAATSSVLHHWPEPRRVLAEIARVLEPGGRLALTDWRADHLFTRLRDLKLRRTDPSHHRVYTTRESCDMLESAGFRIRSTSRYRLGWSWGFVTILARAEG